MPREAAASASKSVAARVHSSKLAAAEAASGAAPQFPQYHRRCGRPTLRLRPARLARDPLLDPGGAARSRPRYRPRRLAAARASASRPGRALRGARGRDARPRRRRGAGAARPGPSWRFRRGAGPPDVERGRRTRARVRWVTSPGLAAPRSGSGRSTRPLLRTVPRPRPDVDFGALLERVQRCLPPRRASRARRRAGLCDELPAPAARAEHARLGLLALPCARAPTRRYPRYPRLPVPPAPATSRATGAAARRSVSASRAAGSGSPSWLTSGAS